MAFDGAFLRVEISTQPGGHTLRIMDTGEFAALNLTTSSYLKRLHEESPLVSFYGLVTKKPKTTTFSLSINIIGPESLGSLVGALLGDYGAYLQQPEYLEGAIEYINPQILRLPGKEGLPTPWCEPAARHITGSELQQAIKLLDQQCEPTSDGWGTLPEPVGLRTPLVE